MEQPPYDLWMVSLDEQLIRLTSDLATDINPIWVYGVNKIVFQKEGQGLWEMDLNSNQFFRLYPQNVEFVILQ